jgi:16S rRNA (cytosine967-C5)-methyltransferase
LPLGCSADNPWWQLWPHIHGTDGFFGAVFQKKALPKGQSPEKGEGKETQVKTKKPAKELK